MIADASKTTLAYVAEVTAGTTPATPVFKKARFTGGPGLQVVQDYVTSDEIRPDRNIADRARVGRRVEGGYDFELSYGSYDDWLESLFQKAWSTNVLENGVTPKSFTFEEIFSGAATEYKRVRGVYVNSMTLAMAANQKVTGNFGLMGFGVPESAQEIVSGATYNEPNENPILTASNDFASFAMTGVTSPKIQSINLSITNNMRMQPVVGAIDAAGVGSGRFDVTGDITMYFENAQAYGLFLANTYTDLAFRIGGSTTLKYDVVLPKIRFTDASVAAAGNDTDVPITLSFGAVYDAGDGHTMEITRTPA